MIHHILLYLDLTQAGQLGDRCVPRHKKSDVGRHAPGDGKHVEAVHVVLVPHLMKVIRSLSQILKRKGSKSMAAFNQFIVYLGASPWWRQEHGVSNKMRNNLEEIPNNKLYLVFHAIHSGVVAGHLDLVDVDVHRDDPVTRQGELDGVPANPTEAVHHYPAPHHLCDVSGDLLRGDRVP